MKTALAAEELRLRRTIAPVGVATSVASLRGVSRVYRDNLAAEGLSLILKESLELGEAPRVKSTLRFSTSRLDSSPDVGEVFHHDSGSRLNAFEDLRGKHVVAIPSESLFTSSEASKAPFGGLSAFGLQITLEAKGTLDYFFHVPVTMKAVVRADSRASDTKVHTDSFTVTYKRDTRQTNHDMEPETSLAVDNVSRCRRATDCILGIFREFEGYFHSATCCRHTDNAFVPVYFEGVQVIPRLAENRLRTRCLSTFFNPGLCRLQSLRCFPYCLHVQVRDKLRKSSLARAVGKSVQVIGISIPLFPSNATNAIKRLGKLLHRFMQSISLFLCRLERYANRSIHKYIIPYPKETLQVFREGGTGAFLYRLKATVPCARR